MTLLLEVNSRGSWSRVGEFEIANLGFVKVRVRALHAAFASCDRHESCRAPSWRVVKTGGRSRKVLWRHGA